MTIRHPVSSCVTCTERRWPSPLVELELELALEDPLLLDRALTELCAEPPRAEELLELADAEPPGSGTQLSTTVPSAL